MAVATLDTLKYANALKAAGVPDKQADVHSAALQDALKTALQDVPNKDDFKSMFAELRQEIKAQSELLRLEMKNQFDQLRHEMKEMEQRLANKISESDQKLKHETKEVELRLKGELVLHRWMLGTVGVGILMVIVRTYLFKTLF